MEMKKRFIFFSILLSICIFSAQARANLYNITDDWSETNNPNGVWSYNEGQNPLPHVNCWQCGTSDWEEPQSGWAKSENGNDRIPFWFKSNGTETFECDFLEGDVVVHTTDNYSGQGNGLANVTWTSPFTGVINIDGGVWMGRDIDRGNDWRLYLNTTLLTNGYIYSGDPYNRTNPFLFKNGSHGVDAISNISVDPGDIIKLEFEKTSAAGDFIGVDMRIEGSPVPLPSSLLLLGSGLLGLIRFKKIRNALK